MSVRVYLAGGFNHTWQSSYRDWRLDIVKGLDNSDPPVILSPNGSVAKFGILEKSIFNCFDFVGPFSNNASDDPIYIKRSIEDSDIVFGWANELTEVEVSKLSAEITYANALGKLVGVGSTGNSDPAWNDTWVAQSIASFFPFGYFADTPKQSLKDCLKSLVGFLPLEKQMALWKNALSRQFFERSLSCAGYVYLIKADTGHYKIGMTTSLPKRLTLFGVKLPFKWDLIHSFPCQHAKEAECMLHRIFDGSRVNGEWFTLSERDETFIKSITEYSQYDSFSGCDISKYPEIDERLWDIALSVQKVA